MNRKLIDRRETRFFSNTANTLVYNQEKVSDFIQAPFSKNEFSAQIERKKLTYSKDQRNVVSNYFVNKYQNVAHSKSVQENINVLKNENSFTITTGHQLNLFTGPVFFIYKIMHVIKMCEELNNEGSGNSFVPVYWMASEDHDFEEINHIHLFGNKVSWESKQEGAVGRFELKDIHTAKEEVKSFFKNNEDILEFIDRSYSANDMLSNATFELVHKLFDAYGLLIIDADDHLLKTSFSDILEKELKESFSGDLVRSTSEKLTERGFKAQVHPRDINLFFLGENYRERIIKNDVGQYKAGEAVYDVEELLQILKDSPEKFSPNVVLRPLFQEFLLPNLCYVGGGGEMAYWLQLKGVFDAVNVTYPLIQVRNSVQFISQSIKKRIDKLSLDFTDFLKEPNDLKKEFVANNTQNVIEFNDIENSLELLANQMREKVEGTFEGLKSYTESEISRMNKQLANFKGKINREQKQKFETSLNQIDKIYGSLFPGNGLAERNENVLLYFAQFGVEEFLNVVHESIDPFEKDLIVLD